VAFAETGAQAAAVTAAAPFDVALIDMGLGLPRRRRLRGRPPDYRQLES